MRLFIVAFLLLAPALASADGVAERTPDVSKMKNDDCARARKANKPCVINMGEGEKIDGTSPTAGGTAVGVIKFEPKPSMIRLRKDFIVEILKTAEDL